MIGFQKLRLQRLSFYLPHVMSSCFWKGEVPCRKKSKQPVFHGAPFLRRAAKKGYGSLIVEVGPFCPCQKPDETAAGASARRDPGRWQVLFLQFNVLDGCCGGCKRFQFALSKHSEVRKDGRQNSRLPSGHRLGVPFLNMESVMLAYVHLLEIDKNGSLSHSSEAWKDYIGSFWFVLGQTGKY